MVTEDIYLKFWKISLKKAVLIINGPNLNLLGNREQSIYGDISFEKYLIELQEHFSEVVIDYFQSNHCG